MKTPKPATIPEVAPTPATEPGALYIGPERTAALAEYIKTRGAEIRAENAAKAPAPVTNSKGESK